MFRRFNKIESNNNISARFHLNLIQLEFSGHRIITRFLSKMESQKIELFQCVKKVFKLMGIKRSHPNRNCSINLRILLCYVPVTLFLISSTAYMVLKANSVLEFNDSFYVNVTALLNICSISISICNMPDILNVIKKLEKTIAKSKRNPSLWYVTIIVSKEFNEKLPFLPINIQN